MIVRMIKNLENRMEKMRELFNKDLQELMSKAYTNTLEGINSRKSEAEERIGELEDKMVGITSK